MSTTATSQMTYTSPLLGKAEQSAAANAASAKAAATNGTLGQNDFLKLLVTQLQQQDPLNPMDDQAYVAELAQFSSLEQLTNINTGITTMTTSINSQGQVNAVGMIGKDVTAAGNSILKSGSTITPISYTLPSAATSVQANILDSTGNVVKTVNIGAQNAGTYKISWDGTDSGGNTVSDGTYTFTLAAQGAGGTALNVTPQISGTVTGVQSSNGTYLLNLSNGQQVSMLGVTSVNNPTTSTSS
ncbi:MAG: flagellar hook assembly protein FlgD [Desulfovibrionaceae bacterium]|nr:flagellar hook assembly protein FlgD [Desulfovibrionaceae bacterium]MBF0514030.1 flagellar hook assembly protein FlgD [Desulfovibrionaceae bacterium]